MSTFLTDPNIEGQAKGLSSTKNQNANQQIIHETPVQKQPFLPKIDDNSRYEDTKNKPKSVLALAESKSKKMHSNASKPGTKTLNSYSSTKVSL